MPNSLLNFLIELVLIFPTVLIALTFHECAHGFAAYKLGDPTAKFMGRLTLNPIKHLDPIGAICMLIAHFGWAKPVPIDITNFKHPKRDLAISALFGPLANLLLGFIGCFLFTLADNLLPYQIDNKFLDVLALLLINFLYYFGWLNISLALFNLSPIPPLDGSKILYAFLPAKPNTWLKMHEREISVGFMLLIIVDSRFLGGILTGFLSLGVNGIFNGFTALFNLMF